ncbi:MAG: hypothetical protein P8184_04005 [Calditrichia bacterium]
MIESTKINSSNLKTTLEELEEVFLDELENMLVTRLMENKRVVLPGTKNNVVEYAGRTNFKIRLKRPNKNVWSITFQDFRESIRKVLREGNLAPVDGMGDGGSVKNGKFDLPTLFLLHVLPPEEYSKRSFVGNHVVHPTLGEGEVLRISDSGNVEVEFPSRVVMLKPSFVELKTAS